MSRQQQEFFTSDLGSVKLDQTYITFLLRQNTRIKRERLLISPEEGLVLETPQESTLRRAQNLIIKKKEWVLKELKNIKKAHKRVAEIKRYEQSVLVFGKEKVVIIKREQPKDYILEIRNSISLGFKSAHPSHEEIQKLLNDWLKEKAKNYFTMRVRQINKGTFEYGKVMIKTQKNLWGSCSAEGNINLNWRLISAPKHESDYIILHELCHTRHLNHSKRYWKLVETVCPTYKQAEKWFDQFGFVLYLNPRF